VSDPKSEIAKAYGVTRNAWLPSRRATFVIDSAGVVCQVITAELDVTRHAREALASAETLVTAAP
jgi:alkyl hydroperoxide reductase subunit AhpC